MAMEKKSENLPTHISMGDDLYQACTLGQNLSALITPHWKELRS